MDPGKMDPELIAKAMGIDAVKLGRLVVKIEMAYRAREMRPAGKKHRPIDPMFRWSKRLFRRVHRFIQRNNMFHPRAHGGVARRSCFSSANSHLGHRYVWTRDIADCYPSITPAKFKNEMIFLGFSARSAEFLSMLFTVRGSIPQGSPLSNDAVNFYFYRIDQAMATFCGRHSLAYSRVVDDFVISGNSFAAGEWATLHLENLLALHGILINAKKRRESGFQVKEQGTRVHNIVVSNSRGTAICPEHQKKAMELAASFLAGCKSLQADSLVRMAFKRQTVLGWMYQCRQAHFGPARQVRQLIEAGDAAVRRKLRSLGLSSPKNEWWKMTAKFSEPKRLEHLWNVKNTKSSCLI